MRSKTWTFVSVTLCMLAIVAAWLVVRLERSSKISLGAIANEQLVLDAATRRAQERIRAADENRAAALSKIATASRETLADAVATKTDAVVTNPMDLVRSDPELRALYLKGKRAEFATTYGPLFRTLNLSPVQIARFLEIAMKREKLQIDLEPARSGREAVVAKAATALIADGEADFDRAMLDLLGEPGAQQLAEFQRTLPARDLVARFAGTAVLANLPVTPAQADSLIQLLVQASTGSGRIGWSAVDGQLGGILSPDQVALLQTGGLRPSDQLRLAQQQFRQATGFPRH